MPRRIVSLLLYGIVFVLCVESQETDQLIYQGMFDSITFEADEILLLQLNLETIEPKETRFSYEFVTRYGLDFIRSKDSPDTELLLLHNGYFANLYFDEYTPFSSLTLYTSDPRLGYKYSNIRNAVYSASSFLTEGDIRYTAENLGTSTLSKPWVEGVPGPGIGETLNLTWQTWTERDGSVGGIGALILSNGYVSYRNPSLFEKNNRAKGLRISDVAGTYTVDVELMDTPNPQVIFLPRAVREMEIEILSVYKGTTWDDTCINYIKGLELRQSRWLYDTMTAAGETIIGRVR